MAENIDYHLMFEGILRPCQSLFPVYLYLNSIPELSPRYKSVKKRYRCVGAGTFRVLCVMGAVSHMWVISAVNDLDVCDDSSVCFLCYCFIGLALKGLLFDTVMLFFLLLFLF